MRNPMPDQDDLAYEAPAVEDLVVDEGPASVQAGVTQQTPPS
jgi:hypothetical protein